MRSTLQPDPAVEVHLPPIPAIIIPAASKQASTRFQDQAIQSVDAFLASGSEGAHGSSR
jgi:hypothetical protein